MLFGDLSFFDFAIITLLIIVFAGGTAAARGYLNPAERKRFHRIERKLDLLLQHNNLHYEEDKAPTWQELADDPARKIGAIAAYREEHGVGLAEAKEAVEEYIRGK